MASPPTEPSSAPPTTASSPATPSTPKPIHSLVLDTGPLIKNDPPAAALVASAEKLYTVAAVLAEIRDAATRSRVETTLLPFVTLRAPSPESLRFVQGFARRTGDLAVLSRPDLEVLALGYELECERNGGDWRLRNTPGQKRLNGRPCRADASPSGGHGAEPVGAEASQGAEAQESPDAAASDDDDDDDDDDNDDEAAATAAADQAPLESSMQRLNLTSRSHSTQTHPPSPQEAADGDKADETTAAAPAPAPPAPAHAEDDDDNSDDDDDDDGWITPSNVRRHQAADAGTATPAQPAQTTLQAAVLTSDYAMQNVALRMNLNLVAPSLARITHLKNWVLRCHGCFSITKDLAKQFCPSCGQATLTRASCSTDAHGTFRVHLKHNFQWNKRGNVYSVPKPVHGSANGRRLPKKAGGQNGWGRDLVLAEDQKEYVRAEEERRRARNKDLMDEDRLPGILSGQRSGPGAGLRVGAGRNVNAKRRH